MASSFLEIVVREELTMNEILLTRDEIESLYDSEWVLVEDPELSKNLEVLRGKVVWHSKDRDEVYAKALELRPRHPAFLYIGAPPQDMEYMLGAAFVLPVPRSAACSAWTSCGIPA